MKVPILSYTHIVLSIILAVFLLSSTVVSGSRTVQDQLNRQITLTDYPERIIALAPSISEIIFALGEENRLVGVTRFTNYPSEADRLPKVGSYVHLDIEKIVALKPDICIAVKDGNPREVIDRLQSLNIPVYAVDPRNIDAVMESLLKIGELLDAGEKATYLVNDMQSRIERVKHKVGGIDYRPRVFFQIGISPIVSAGSHTFIDELIRFAGGINIAAGPVTYPRFSREQVLVMAPEVFIITSMARDKVFEKVKAQWRRWPDLPAVKNDRIVLVDSDLFDRASPRIVDALELLAKLIHPELFENIK